VLQLSF
jgi:hypothetical protein